MADDEWVEDTCDFVLPDGTVCGAHVGYGVRWMHLRCCDDHAPAEPEEEPPIVGRPLGAADGLPWGALGWEPETIPPAKTGEEDADTPPCGDCGAVFPEPHADDCVNRGEEEP